MSTYIKDPLKEAVWSAAGWGPTSCSICGSEMLRGVGLTYCSNKTCCEKQNQDWLGKQMNTNPYWRTDEE